MDYIDKLSNELLLEVLEWLYFIEEFHRHYLDDTTLYPAFRSLALTSKRLSNLSYGFRYRKLRNTVQNKTGLAYSIIKLLTVQGLGNHVKEISWNCAVDLTDTSDNEYDSDTQARDSNVMDSFPGPDELLTSVLAKTPAVSSLWVMDKGHEYFNSPYKPKDLPLWVSFLSASAAMPTPSVSHRFKNLKRITIRMLTLRLKDIGGILRLPHLRQVQLDYLVQSEDKISFETETSATCACEPGVSMVEDLLLFDPMINSKALAQLLSYFKGLRSFRSIFQEGQNEDGELEYRSTHRIKYRHPIVAAALAEQRHTLQTLHLQEGDDYARWDMRRERHEYNPTWLSDLQSLHHVEDLHIGFRAFASTIGSPALSHHLPPNVREPTFYLEDKHDGPYWKQALMDLALSCRQALPELRHVRLTNYYWTEDVRWTEDDERHFKTLFKDNGVEMDFKLEEPYD